MNKDSKNIYILGISCFYHDAAACLLRNGEIIAAAEEERFTREKHDSEFPKRAISYCLKEGSIEAKDIDYIGFYDKPLLKFERILLTCLSTFPRSYRLFRNAISIWIKRKLWIREIIRKELDYKNKIYFIEHHLSHAASSFLVSPFDRAATLTIDGVGEWVTTVCGKGVGNKIELIQELNFPHSLGLLYSAFTYYLGFEVNDGEYKVMGLAPYGKPIYYSKIVENLMDIRDDGSFKLNMKYFAYHYSFASTNKEFDKLFGGVPRKPEGELTQRHKDVAASIQKAIEEIILRMLNHLYKNTGLKNLCLAGGVALNCVANGRILKEAPFKNLFIQPAAGDSGGAVGVAAYIYYSILKNKRKFVWQHTYWGPKFSEEEIKDYLEKNNIPFKRYQEKELFQEMAKLISEQKVIGWFQGRMEFGPRALGNRSILADARNKENWQKVNLKIKFRESFRPFAPTVLEEESNKYFDLNIPSPYMLLVAQVKRTDIPAVTHVNNSARIQTVNRKENHFYYDLIKEFQKLTGCSVIINTSFNIRGEPIVCNPYDAFLCFMKTGMDYLVLGNFVIAKKEMTKFSKEDIDKINNPFKIG